ncbi:M23 family metallopeptidase [Modestobacter versicolor]|uniref:M23 family metallopeptidase n=1 Tax=Modestobacter versicolor TaxID=429133 RepID=UPI0034DF2D07
MDPQHLARLDDDGTVRRNRTRSAGGPSATGSPEGPEVPAPAPVPLFSAPGSRPGRRALTLLRGGRAEHTTIVLRPDGLSDAWPLPVEPEGPVLTDAWPLVDVDALQLAGIAETGPEPSDARPFDADAVVAAVAAGSGPRHRAPTTLRVRRPAVYVAAALIGAAGVAATTAASGPGSTAQADEPISVAEELGLVQAEQPVLSEDEATARLQEFAATRAEREDAQIAAAQVQAQADQAAIDAAAAAQAAAQAAAAEAARPKAVLPVDGARLTSGFGYRWGTQHAGVDFAAPLGTPEYAAMDGVVVRAGAASGFGLAVYVQHENGDVTVYGHMQEILVAEGQSVKAGETIALLGNQGQSTGPHLHFEVHVGGMDGTKVDPLPWLRERGVQV